MDFNAYLDKAWNDHASDSLKVSKTFNEGLEMVETAEQLNDMAVLINHVMGTHLGQWQAGIVLLQSLHQHKAFSSETEAAKTVHRAVAALGLANNPQGNLQEHSQSEQIRILAMSSAALVDFDVPRAHTLMKQAVGMAETSLDAKDPANRSLAVSGNNMASQLEEKPNRSADETDLMIFAARMARKYWEIAGTPVNVLLAEYRMAKSLLQAQQAEKARHHAQTCLEMCEANKGEAHHFFQGYEALAMTEKALGNQIGFQAALNQAQKHFEAIKVDFQSWYAKDLDQLRAAVSK
jgi:hypothetical protein